MKLITIAAALVTVFSLTSCSFLDKAKEFNANELEKAVAFGQCVSSCYSTTYGAPPTEVAP